MNRVVILGNHTQGLGIVRSLKEYPVEVHMINDRNIALARFSKYLDSYHCLSRGTFSSLSDSSSASLLLEELNKIAVSEEKISVFCTDEDLVYFMNANRDSLDIAYKLPENDIELITDKYCFYQLLRSLGLHSPRTCLLSEFCDQANEFLEEGFLLKGRRGALFRHLTKQKAVQIKSALDIQSFNADVDIPSDQVIVQEILKQNIKVLSVCGFSVNGEMYEEFQYIKVRQRPSKYGTGTFLKSIYDLRLSDLAETLIGGLRYTGIFEIEAMLDDDMYKVIEMNPRTWKSINFASDCGVNLCRSYCDFLFKNVLPEKARRTAKIDHSWTHLSQDLISMITTWSFDRRAAKSHYCVFDRHDLLPFIMEGVLMPLILLKV